MRVDCGLLTMQKECLFSTGAFDPYQRRGVSHGFTLFTLFCIDYPYLMDVTCLVEMLVLHPAACEEILHPSYCVIISLWIIVYSLSDCFVDI